VPCSRPNFVELCLRLTEEDERAFEELWRHLGLSVDWSRTYATIDPDARRASQLAFLHALAAGQAYQAEAPTLWDVTFRTAVAQAELEDREVPGALHRLRFEDLEIVTTRPELLPACVGLVAHPDDERYRDRVGSTVRSPLFDVPVPVFSHPRAEPEKGTGLAMVCTFGDLTAVLWWRELRLPIRSIVTRDGRVRHDPPPGVPAGRAWAAVAGKSMAEARSAIVELLRAAGVLVGEPAPVAHSVKFYEKGSQPLEITTSRQWFIRLLQHRDALLALGRRLDWQPPAMQVRYENWVAGLNSDWLISRQRFFGVPIPLWYPLDADGHVDHQRPLTPHEDALPVDPSTDTPTGYEPGQRGAPGGFVGDPDVMDTWATSSLTPQIAGGWGRDPDLFERVFPMDLRPQSHEIIRTWLFYTVVRSEFEHDRLPWSTVAISGWILDPDRKKMSKSKGNVVTPMALLEQYGSDPVRYWAARVRPGTDSVLDEGQIRVGRRLAIKLLNVSRFVLSHTEMGGSGDSQLEAVDAALLNTLEATVAEATDAFEQYDYARALETSERFFWTFCDDYVELVKNRAYGSSGEAAAASARHTLRTALVVLVRLFAPFLPFVTEEVWSWSQAGSVHRARWPTVPLAATPEGSLAFETAAVVLAAIRKAKSEASCSMRAPVARLVVADRPENLAALRLAEEDVKLAGAVAVVEYAEAPSLTVTVELQPVEPSEANS
jgi:valyl-tRNA synthetase